MSAEATIDPQAARAPAAEDGRGSDAASPGAEGQGSPWLLAVCCVAQFMVILDLSIVNVALPHMQSDLGFTAPELLWVVDAYMIMFAGFLILGGRAADHFGQRRVFVAALALFGIASLAGGLAPDRAMLIGARGLQGFAGAFMAACSLAIIISSFTGTRLHRAIGLWAAMNGAGGAAGVLFGGVITEFLSWRWVLLINPPIAITAAVVASLVVRERRRAQEGHNFDLAGALTLTAGQLALVYGVVEAGLAGWSTASALGPIVLGCALLGAFVVIETRVAAAPLIPIKELTRPLKVANNIVVLFSAALFPMWFLSTLYMQEVLGLSPLHAGLIFLPMTLTIFLVASQAGRLVSHFGVRTVLGGGLTLMTVGLLLFTRLEPSGSAIVYVMIPGLLTTAGIAMSIVPSTIAATQGAREGQAGLASGLVNTSRQVGGGLGLALLITLATQRSTNLIGAGHGALSSLTDGFRLAYLIAACLAAAAAVVTFAFVPKPAAELRPATRHWALTIVAVLAGFLAIDSVFAGSRGAPIGAYTTQGAYSFYSAPSLHPPRLTLDRAPAAGTPATAAPASGTPASATPASATPASGTPAAATLAPGYIFATNFYDLNEPPLVGQSGPLILDSRLQPVWFQPVPERVAAANLSLQTYDGKPALAWWQGVVTNTGATESGEDVVVNQHYQTVAKLRGADGWKITLHALAIQGNDAWVTASKDIPIDLSRYGGAYNGAMTDAAVQEYDLATGRLLRSWDALGHIPLGASYATVPTNGFPWDAYHVNAIDLVGNGAFLVSMRNTWAAYLVDIRTGAIEWTLGGRRSSFRFGPGAEFQWQHDVALTPGAPPSSTSGSAPGSTSGSAPGSTSGSTSGSTADSTPSTVSLFDDHCCQLTGGGTSVHATAPSRALVLKLDPAAHTATLAAQYTGGGGFESEYMGDAQPLANGGMFVGWGSERWFSEYTHSGRLLLEGEFPQPDQTYRATLNPWVGLPLSPPAGAARRTSDGGTTVYASWNGATRLAAWRVLAGHGAGGLSVVASAPRSGFETAIPVPRASGEDQSFEVQALDARGRVIGASRPFAAGG